jgi:putative restriction endonuclease
MHFIEGEIYATRMALHLAGMHRPLQAGICGTTRTGAESIIISPDYEDNRDLGHTIYYAGAGGRDPKTGRQNSDQLAERGTLALIHSCQHQLPIRVIRKIPDPAGPYYRYDGLYIVVDYTIEVGISGYKVYMFRLVRG